MVGGRSDPGSVAAIVRRLIAVTAALVAAGHVALALVLGGHAAVPVAVTGGALLAIIAAVAWLLDSRLARPLDRLALDLAIIGRENPAHRLRAGRRDWPKRVVAGLETMRSRLEHAEAQGSQAIAEVKRMGEEQKHWLEAVLLDLTEGIIVCNLQHQVLLYNQVAADLVGGVQSLGLGRLLFPTLTREPVLHALERQMQRLEGGWADAGERFMCGTAAGQRLLDARIGLVLDAKGAPSSYVLSFTELGDEAAALAKRDDLLQLATEGLRAPVANLRAAAETLAEHPDMAAADREAFQRVILAESAALADRLETLARNYRDLGAGRWMMGEIYSSDLIASLIRRLVGTGLQLTATGLPQWLYGDSLSLLVLLESLLRQLHAATGVEAFDIAPSAGDHRVYLDLIWQGDAIRGGQIDEWLDRPLVGGLGALTGRAVLHRHGSDAWSQPAGDGFARLRLPLASIEGSMVRKRPVRPQRPEFYDFDLLRHPLPTKRFAERLLKQLTYVAFDLETTGLRPSAGDEVVSIAGVRVVNGRILTMETFERLVNPGRRIPEPSIGFHGISDEMVRDKPPFALVLPDFHRFAADAVLVAHNAAFDLTFLHRAGGGRLSFDQPVVDTLLLSAHLDPQETDHSLDAIAARLGLSIVDRHSALGDSLLAAAVLLRLLDRCEERGITRLGQLIAATDMVGQLRAHRQQY